MSVNVTNRRHVLPRPAICASKQKIFDADQTGWVIPTTLQAELDLVLLPSGPPPTRLIMEWPLNRQRGTLTWRGWHTAAGYALYATCSYDPTAASWAITGSCIQDPIHSLAWAGGDIPEVPGPPRHAGVSGLTTLPGWTNYEFTISY